ncbi:MAG: hypothetical protein ACRYFX_22130 [Janthinobacterium lividum]
MRKLHVLLALGLLLGPLGCAKKDDATPAPAAGMARYKLDGVTRTCQASYITPANTGIPGLDLLNLTLVTTPEPVGGKEYAVLYFTKATGRPVREYQMAATTYFSPGSKISTAYYSNATSITQTDTGSYSGTFDGSFVSTATTPGSNSNITEGAFTEVRP